MTRRPPSDPPEGPPTIAGRFAVEPEESASGEPVLVVLEGWEIGRQVRVGRPLVVGRSSAADLRIPGPEVSRRHARLAVGEAGELAVEDLGSANGVWVNERRVSRALLVTGDRIRIGRAVFLVTRDDAVEARFFHRVHRRVHRDELTGLERGDAILAAIESEINRGHGPLVVGMTDLDGLREVNARHGHRAGRAVVAAMGTALRQALAPSTRAGLYGGDEVILLFPRTGLADAVDAAERIRSAIESMRVEHGTEQLGVTISIGLAEWPGHGSATPDLVAAADRALYLAKSGGRNRVATADGVGG
jgi:diguanylate cyclase (GGDEF)-like protein